MFRFYLRLSLLCVLLFTLLGMAMSALGSTQPIHPALRGFVEGCEGVPQPCWYGIVPGVTTLEQAESILIEHGFVFHDVENFPYWEGDTWCRVYLSGLNAERSTIFIELCRLVTLQDVLSTFPSFPSYVGRNCRNGYHLIMSNFVIYTYGIYRNTPVGSFQLGASDLVDTLHAPQNRWRGFGYHYPITAGTGGLGCG